MGYVGSNRFDTGLSSIGWMRNDSIENLGISFRILEEKKWFWEEMSCNFVGFSAQTGI